MSPHARVRSSRVGKAAGRRCGRGGRAGRGSVAGGAGRGRRPAGRRGAGGRGGPAGAGRTGPGRRRAPAGPRPPASPPDGAGGRRRCGRPGRRGRGPTAAMPAPPGRGRRPGRSAPAAGGRRGRRPGPPPARRSSRSMRSSMAAGDTSASGRHSRTSDTSSSTRVSGASRMATRASPSTSMARTMAARPMRAAWLSMRATSSSGRPTRPRATVARNAWRRCSSSSPARRRGSWPAPTRSATATRARPDVALAQRLDHLVGGRAGVVDPARGRHLVELRQGVAGRPRPPLGHQADDLVGDVEPGLLGHPAQVVGQHVDRQQVELEVLGAAADGGQHLLRLGGGQHEDHVPGRLLQRLQEGVGRLGGEHVDLVDDVDLPPSGRAQAGPGHQVAHGVDPPVGGGVELEHVERAALGDLHARGADAARLAGVGIGAVQGLGQDAGARRLARAPGPAEQVGVRHPPVADRVAQGVADVVLAPDVDEPLGPEPPVEGLEGHGCSSPTLGPGWDTVGARRRRGGDGPPIHAAARLDCGTRVPPLRAAAFRP